MSHHRMTIAFLLAALLWAMPSPAGADCIDLDGDGACAGEDCDDGDAAVHPGAVELCDGVDADCSLEWSGPEAGSTWSATDPVRLNAWMPAGPRWLTEIEAWVEASAPVEVVWLVVDLGSGATLWSAGAEVPGTGWATSPPVGLQLNEGGVYGVGFAASGEVTYGFDGGGLGADALGTLLNGYARNDASAEDAALAQPVGEAFLVRAGVDTEVDLDGDAVPVCVDCDDEDGSLGAPQPEVCDGVDNDCDGFLPPAELDGDSDGFTGCDDCDDSDPAYHPGAPEICANHDMDCNGVLWLGASVDEDGDGASVCDDCDDQDAARGPGFPELCDGIDTNCDGYVGYAEEDADGDGFLRCEDCADWDASVFPGNVDVCDGVDTDCLLVDERDWDGDGWRVCHGDCDDYEFWVNPGEPEHCDGLDSDCDPTTQAADEDGDGVDCESDCRDGDPTVFPGAVEVCDGEDTDCDGFRGTDELDGDGDGQRPCEGDCDDSDSRIAVGRPEACDGEDTDCDGVIPPEEQDVDEDGVRGCEGDCADEDPRRFAGADELCDGLDNDCDGDVEVGRDDIDGDGWVGCEDCDDVRDWVFPGAAEVCDGQDSNCDGFAGAAASLARDRSRLRSGYLGMQFSPPHVLRVEGISVELSQYEGGYLELTLFEVALPLGVVTEVFRRPDWGEAVGAGVKSLAFEFPLELDPERVYLLGLYGQNPVGIRGQYALEAPGVESGFAQLSPVRLQWQPSEGDLVADGSYPAFLPGFTLHATTEVDADGDGALDCLEDPASAPWPAGGGCEAPAAWILVFGLAGLRRRSEGA